MALEDSASKSRYHLAIFDDHLRSIPLLAGTILVGRSKSSHLQLNDDLLSRKHCSLTLIDERLTLVDLNSSNGTYVNGARVSTLDLSLDDILELGHTVLVVFDGNSWGRGEGLLNLRNPLKAQELVQILTNGAKELKRCRPLALSSKNNGVRPHKGLTDGERAFLRWLERAENPLLPGLAADYLTHKMVSLLVRNSRPIRDAFTKVLEEMMQPEYLARFQSVDELHSAIHERVANELASLSAEEEHRLSDRDLLEPGETSSAPAAREDREERDEPLPPESVV